MPRCALHRVPNTNPINHVFPSKMIYIRAVHIHQHRPKLARTPGSKENIVPLTSLLQSELAEQTLLGIATGTLLWRQNRWQTFLEPGDADNPFGSCVTAHCFIGHIVTAMDLPSAWLITRRPDGTFAIAGRPAKRSAIAFGGYNGDDSMLIARPEDRVRRTRHGVPVVHVANRAAQLLDISLPEVYRLADPHLSLAQIKQTLDTIRVRPRTPTVPAATVSTPASI
jgi:hypothetical protein